MPERKNPMAQNRKKDCQPKKAMAQNRKRKSGPKAKSHLWYASAAQKKHIPSPSVEF